MADNRKPEKPGARGPKAAPKKETGKAGGASSTPTGSKGARHGQSSAATRAGASTERPGAAQGPATPTQNPPGGKAEASAAQAGRAANKAGAENTISFEEKKEQTRQKRIKLRRKFRLRNLLVAAVVITGLLIYITGSYVAIGLQFADWFDGAQMAIAGGDGFPAEFSMPGFVQAQSMGGGAFAAVGQQDLTIYAPGGRAFYSLQHSYVNPGLSAGDDRVLLYNRGNMEYMVLSRSKVLQNGRTSQPIFFARISKGGRLAVCTRSASYRAELHIYDSTLPNEPYFSYYLADENPYDLTFHPNNKLVALSCLTVDGAGVQEGCIYLFRTNRPGEKAELCRIKTPGAMPLQVHFLSRDRILVVLDDYAAIYNTKGDRVARYDYAGLQLISADSDGKVTALVFGSPLQDSLTIQLLDKDLQPVAARQATGTASPRVMVSERGVFLLSGQEVFAYSRAGEPLATQHLPQRSYGLVEGREPLALTAGRIVSLQPMLRGDAVDAGTDVLAAAVLHRRLCGL